MSTVDQSVGHDEYLHRGRGNCNDDRRSWRMDHAADLQMGSKQKQRIALQMDGEMQVSTADRSVGHDDYDNGRRANINGDGRTMLLMVKINYVWVSFTRKVNRKQKH